MLTSKQTEVATGKWARTNILEGAVRSGKTHVINYITPYLVMFGPQGKGAIIAKTLETLRENILDPMKAIMGRSMSYSDAGRRITIEGRRIRGVGANDEKSKGKIQGDTLAWAVGDELALWPMSFFKMLLSRLSPKGAMFFGSTNPEGPYHWLKEDFIDRAGDIDLISHRFRIEDNTHLDPDYVAALKSEYTGVWYKRYIEGLWVMADGVIYDMFDPAIHVTNGPVFDVEPHLIMGVDFGMGNPTTFSKIWTDMKRAHVSGEYYYDSNKEGRQKGVPEYADDLIDFLGDDRAKLRAIYPDPSATEFIFELKRRGLPVKKSVNDVIPGIQFVSRLLSNQMLTYSRKCAQTIKEFASYVWDPSAQKRGEDKPMKINDHCMDRDKYPLLTHLGQNSGKPQYTTAAKRRPAQRGTF